MRVRRGLTLIEAIITTVITAVMLVAAMNATGASVNFRTGTANRAIAQKLADGLMTDILTLPYADPNGGKTFGLDAGETQGAKSTFDDCDDFNAWTESPPQDRNGHPLTDLVGWSRSVKVEWVAAGDAYTVSSTESGLKRVTVSVQYNGKTLCTRVAIRTAAP